MPLVTHPQDELPHAPLPSVVPVPETPIFEAIRFEPPAFTPPPLEGMPRPPQLLRGPEDTEERGTGRRLARIDDVEPVAMPWGDDHDDELPPSART